MARRLFVVTSLALSCAFGCSRERPPAPAESEAAKKEDADIRWRLSRAKRKLDEKRAQEARRAEAARWKSRAEQAERQGDMKAALRYYQEAAKHVVDQTEKADVSSKVSSLEREIAGREAEARRQAGYDNAMTRARSYAGRRQWKGAAAAYAEALRQKPGDSQAARMLAEAKKHLGPAKTMTLDLGGGVTMELVLIPAGEFTMGSPNSEANRGGNEGPQHRVRITQAFYMGKHEVTQAQYQAIMRKNPSKFKGANNPVEQVSWNDAAEFCRKLSQRTGKTVRLPTEAEWEYACRAGTTTRFCFGDGGNRPLRDYAWYYINRGGKTHPVGGKRANGWGLYDMHGNVWEWCQDRHGSYPSGTVSDPTGPANGGYRVLRGGCSYSYSQNCRSARRLSLVPSVRSSGFRVVAPPSPGVRESAGVSRAAAGSLQQHVPGPATAVPAVPAARATECTRSAPTGSRPGRRDCSSRG